MTLDLSTMATAASIAMDAFSVSVCMGICHGGLGRRDALTLGGFWDIPVWNAADQGTDRREHNRLFEQLGAMDRRRSDHMGGIEHDKGSVHGKGQDKLLHEHNVDERFDTGLCHFS